MSIFYLFICMIYSFLSLVVCHQQETCFLLVTLVNRDTHITVAVTWRGRFIVHHPQTLQIGREQADDIYEAGCGAEVKWAEAGRAAEKGSQKFQMQEKALVKNR